MRLLIYRLVRLIWLAPKLLYTWLMIGRPNPYFDTQYYAKSNPHIADVRALQILHYVLRGENRGFAPNRLFDPAYYGAANGFNTDTNGASFAHYLRHGAKNNARPSKLFDPVYYATHYPEFSDTHSDPARHYQECGIFNRVYPCAEVENLQRKPKVSIITPIYNTDSFFLKQCIESVLFQAYPDWELCLIDDGSSRPGIHEELIEYTKMDERIKLLTLEENGGISVASTRGLGLATGEYIAFLDHDDELQINTLYEFVEQINQRDPDIMYSDEELISESHRSLGVMYKPDFNPVLLLNHNYITHFVMLKAQLLEQINPFPEGSAGAQDHDLLLQLTEVTENILHIPLNLYKWRSSETSTSANADQKPYAVEASIRAVSHALQRRAIDAQIKTGKANFFHDIHLELKSTPSFDIIITPSTETLNNHSELQRLITHCKGERTQLSLILPAETLLTEPQSALLKQDNITTYTLYAQQNPVVVINQIALSSSADFLGFIGQAVIPENKDWVSGLAGYAQLNTAGLVGGNCLTNIPRPENKINFTCPDPSIEDATYYKNFLLHASRCLSGQECSQHTRYISAAFCMIKRDTFQKLSGFDCKNFPKLMYDLDLSLRLLSNGLVNTYVSFCRASIASDFTQTENPAFTPEKQHFKNTWKELLASGDPQLSLPYLLKCTSLNQPEWLEWYA